MTTSKINGNEVFCNLNKFLFKKKIVIVPIIFVLIFTFFIFSEKNSKIIIYHRNLRKTRFFEDNWVALFSLKN